MEPFAVLLDTLTTTPSRKGKLALLVEYFRSTPDPDRGFALAALTDGLFPRLPLRRSLAVLLETRVDPVLYDLSRDYVGDTAETVALLWPAQKAEAPAPTLQALVKALEAANAATAPALLAGWLDTLDATGRWALLKFVTGALRVGVSARLAKTALAGPGETVQVTFTVPSTPGDYPYLCTFAGHYQAGMKGALTVQ